jgi:hypothetical protein
MELGAHTSTHVFVARQHEAAGLKVAILETI